MSIKVVTVVGARPQFIKAAAVSRAIRDDRAHRLHEVIVHTGQHFDDNMSKVFFEELSIPAPDYDLQISGGSHGEMTGRMLTEVERVLQAERPDWVLVYGDTNTTLAGALAAVKLHQPVAHVEAGLRSFNRRMPEEINRIVADRVSTLLFCPTGTAAANLRNEGIVDGVHLCGDVMFDVSLFYRDRARERSQVVKTAGLEAKRFALATCHRAENTDDRQRLEAILSALQRISNEMPVVLPLHPRTRKMIGEFALDRLLAGVTVLEPQSFLDMIALEQAAALILTDSGGVQKEAFFFEVPCVTFRDETEWVETVDAGANALAGADTDRIVAAARSARDGGRGPRPRPYGNGRAAECMVDVLTRSGESHGH
jgi:UDP-GlcNAc3NAcA epimerase